MWKVAIIIVLAYEDGPVLDFTRLYGTRGAALRHCNDLDDVGDANVAAVIALRASSFAMRSAAFSSPALSTSGQLGADGPNRKDGCKDTIDEPCR
jgi:hypothetical protein